MVSTKATFNSQIANFDTSMQPGVYKQPSGLPLHTNTQNYNFGSIGNAEGGTSTPTLP